MHFQFSAYSCYLELMYFQLEAIYWTFIAWRETRNLTVTIKHPKSQLQVLVHQPCPTVFFRHLRPSLSPHSPTAV